MTIRRAPEAFYRRNKVQDLSRHESISGQVLPWLAKHSARSVPAFEGTKDLADADLFGRQRQADAARPPALGVKITITAQVLTTCARWFSDALQHSAISCSDGRSARR